MQYVPYTNFLPGSLMRHNRVFLLALVLLTLLISACSSTPEKENSAHESADLKNISKDITDLVKLPSNEKTQQTQVTDRDNTPRANTQNAYLEQEKKIMSSVPDDVIATYQQALVLMDQQKWQAATALFEQVSAKQSHLSGSYVNQALILRASHVPKQGTKRIAQITACEALIDKAIRVNALNPYAHYFKGQLLEERGLFEQAEQRYAAALSIWPNYTQAQLSMAVLLELYRGKLLDAAQYYARYLQLVPKDKQVQRWQAALAIKIKRAGLSAAQKGE